jgi:NifU-like protein
MWDYTEKVKDHFLHPRNVGEIADPDAVGEVGNITCGDALKLTLKIENDRIVDAKFKTFGCGSAIASSSALTEMVIGKTVDEAVRISNKDIADYLGGLPEAKMHCSVMGREALEAAIARYRGRKLPEYEESPIVCHCFGITEKTIERAVRENNLATVEDVTNYTKAGGGCMSCHPEIEKIIERVRKEQQQEPKAEKKSPGKKLTIVQKVRLIQDVIENEIKPSLKKDGGDISLEDIAGNTVLVTLKGSCASCPGADFTLKQFVETKLREFVSEDIVVEEVRS